MARHRVPEPPDCRSVALTRNWPTIGAGCCSRLSRHGSPHPGGPASRRRARTSAPVKPCSGLSWSAAIQGPSQARPTRSPNQRQNTSAPRARGRVPPACLPGQPGRLRLQQRLHHRHHLREDRRIPAHDPPPCKPNPHCRPPAGADGAARSPPAPSAGPHPTTGPPPRAPGRTPHRLPPRNAPHCAPHPPTAAAP